MSSFDQAADRINAAVEKAEIGSEILSQVANGDEFTEVPTTSGPVPSLKKWQKDNMDLISGGVIARVDKAILSYPTYAAASAAAATLPDGQKIVAPNAAHQDVLSVFSVQGGALVFERLAEGVSVAPGNYGVWENNSAAANQSAFASLESEHPGAHVDLGGKVYAVSSIPTGCRYYNGDFIAGATRVSLRRNKLDNPIDGNSWMAIGNGLTHYFLFGFLYIEATGKMLAFVKPSYRHGASHSAPLNVIYSDDRGLTWRDEKTIHSVPGYDIAHGACAIMAGGRIGSITYIRNLDTADYRNDFVYSDDGGETWAVIEGVSAASAMSVFTYGDLLRYPSVAGGDDVNGFAAYGYAGAGLRVITTTDNGATWTVSSIASMGSAFSEPSVVRVNNENKWIMFARSGVSNLFVSTSTDMKTWTTPVDTGYLLGSNPVYAFVDQGRLFVYCFFRDYDAAGAAKENQVTCLEEDPRLVFAASNLVNKAPRDILDGVERNVGYLCIRKVDQDYVWGYTSAESPGSTSVGGASSIVFGSTRRAPAVGIGYLNAAVERPNLLRNPTFELWSRASTFSNLTAVTKVADGWAYTPSGATATVSRVALTPEESLLFPFHPNYAMSFVTSVPNDYTGIYQKLFDKEALLQFSEQVVTIQVWGIGDLPFISGSNAPKVGIAFDYGVGGSTGVTASVWLRFTEGVGKAWMAVGTVKAPTAVGKTIGTNPFVRINFDSQANGNWNAKICGIKAEFGDIASRFAPVNLDADRVICSRYVQRLELPGIDAVCMLAGQSATSGFGVLPFGEMRAEPSITLATGTAADFEVYPSLAAASAITFSNIGQRSAILGVTTTGLTAGASYALRTKTGSAPAILFDAE